MRSSYISPLLFIILRITTAYYQVLIGRTGVGKSYILNQFGCPRKTCDGMNSCSNDTYFCAKNGIVMVDPVGFDDDREHEVLIDGHVQKLSGLTFPLFNLLESLEKEKVNEVEFFLVKDSNDMRDGFSSKAFLDFVTSTLGCSVKTVLNKYRDEKHSKFFVPGQTEIVREDQIGGIEFHGKTCSFDIVSNWRDKLIKNDLSGIKSEIDTVSCKNLKVRKQELEKELLKSPSTHNNENCLYGDRNKRPLPNDIDQRCKNSKQIVESHCKTDPVCSKQKLELVRRFCKIDPDCVIRRDDFNKDVDKRNNDLKIYKDSVKYSIGQIQKDIEKCESISNYNFL